jgi:hypothetical protein
LKAIQPIPHFDPEEIRRRVEDAKKAISDDRSRSEAAGTGSAMDPVADEGDSRPFGKACGGVMNREYGG